MNQIHKQNNKLIKGRRGARDLLSKVDDSALISWETCSPEIARVILEFEDCLDRSEIPPESSTKHHEDSQSLHERLSSNINQLTKCITVNLFMQDHLTKRNNKKIIVPKTMSTLIDDLEAMGER